MSTQQILAAIDRILAAIDLRPTLQQYLQLGRYWCAYKRLTRDRQFLRELTARGLGIRKVQVWMQAAKFAEQFPGEVEKAHTLEQVVALVKQWKRSLGYEDRTRHRNEVKKNAGKVEERYQVHHGDCREYSWPDTVDFVCTDPEWNNIALYRWLGEWCMTHLRPGGVALIQAGQLHMFRVIDALRQGGLTPVWCFAIQFASSAPEMTKRPFSFGWRPVLVFSHGEPDLRHVAKVCDRTVAPATSGKHAQVKKLHEWQQPLSCIRYWLEKMTVEGWLIADPFAGSGTNAVATKQVGNRRFLGCEDDLDDCLVARGRIAVAQEGMPDDTA